MQTEYLKQLFGLENQVAVVIGGTGELCGAMGEALALAGAEVVLVGRNPEKAEKRLAAIQEKGGRAWFHPADVTTKPALEELLQAVLQRSGQVDLLINGAGVNSPTPFLQVPEEELDRIMNLNFKAVYLACQVFGQYFVNRGKPAGIINIGSISGLNPLSRVFTYSASKGAVHNLSKNLAREWAPLNIRVNILVPGFFPAEQNRKVLTPDRVQAILGHTAMKRFGNAGELAGATLLLASPTAGSFLTGHELVVDGGYHCMTI